MHEKAHQEDRQPFMKKRVKTTSSARSSPTTTTLANRNRRLQKDQPLRGNFQYQSLNACYSNVHSERRHWFRSCSVLENMCKWGEEGTALMQKSLRAIALYEYFARSIE